MLFVILPFFLITRDEAKKEELSLKLEKTREQKEKLKRGWYSTDQMKPFYFEYENKKVSSHKYLVLIWKALVSFIGIF